MTPSNGNDSDDIQAIIDAAGGGNNQQKPIVDNNSDNKDDKSGASSSSAAAGDSANQQNNQQQQSLNDDALNKVLTDRFGISLVDLPVRMQEHNQYKEQLTASPYKSAMGKALDDLLSQNIDPDTAIAYLKTDFEKMDNRDFMAMAMTLKTPGLTKEEASRLIDKKYGLGDFKKDEQDEKDGLLQLKVDAGEERPKTQELKNKMLELGKSRDAVTAEQNNANRINSWQSVKENLKKEFGEIKVPVGMTKDGKPSFEFPFKVGNADVLLKDVDALIQQSPSLLADEKGVALVKQILTDRAIIRNLPALTAALLTHGKSQNNQWWDQVLNNPDFSSNNNGGGGPTATSTDRQLADGIIQQLGG